MNRIAFAGAATAKVAIKAVNTTGELMVKPMNWFVRGNHAEFIQAAMEAGFMLHKVTDYKSAVKYHGEYIVYLWFK